MLIGSRRHHGPTLQVPLARSLALLVLLLAAASGPALAAPIAFVQSNSATPQSPQTTVTVTYVAAQTLGNLNVVVVGWNDSTATVSSVTDSRGNAYALAASPVVQSGTASQAIYYAKNIAAAAAGANTVTVTFSVAAIFPDIRIAEYSGLDTANPLDVAAGAQGNSASSNSGSVTTTNANDLLLGANLVQSTTTGAGASYTKRVITPDGDILEDRIVTTAASYNATAAVDKVQPWIMQMVAFRAAGGGTPPPSISSLNPSSGPVGTSVAIAGANFGATQGTSTVKFNGTAATPMAWSAASITVPVPTSATTGIVVVSVGGVASNGASFTVTVPPPGITSLNPASGLVGASVTIAGTNFGSSQGTSTVKFNGTTAIPTNWSATSIVVPVPTGATTGNVVVTVGGVASNGFSFSVTSISPSITSLNPVSGPVGTSVTIAGLNFGASQGASTVTFNGSAATPAAWSATSIAAPVPTGATNGSVVVTVGGASSNGVSFAVLVPPSITSLTPNSGAVGALVTIAGANFGATQGTSTVTFNGTASAPTRWTATSIAVPVPTGAATGNVVVAVGSLVSNVVNFMVVVPPSITSLTPNSGTVGTSVTIAGANFGATQGTSAVTFNGIAAVPTAWSTSSISVPVPNGATTGNVAVTVGGVASNGVNFTANPPPITAPSGLAATAVSTTQISLSWTAATETGGTITQYFIERCTGAACSNFSQVGTSATTAYNDAGLTVSTSYSYRVRASDAANNFGPYSNVASTTTNSTAPPISFVQTNSATPQTPQTAVSLPFTAGQTAGNLNVVVVGWNDSTATVVSVADSKGNPYALAAPPVVQSGTASLAIYYAKNIAAATAGANTVSVTFTVAAVYPDIRIAEYSGPDTVNPLDVSVGAQGNSTTSDSGPITTTNANDLLLGANLVQTLTTGPGTGYTSRVITNPDGDILEDRVVAATGSYNATAPVSPSGAWIMQLVALQAAAGTGGATPTAPANLTATIAVSVQVNLSWTGSTETGGTIGQYLIERCQVAGCSAFAQIATSATTAFSDTGLSGSTSYTYRVRAKDSLGTFSAYSNLASATTGLSVSPRVTDLTFTRTQQFTASAPVSWLVDGVVGGSAATGTITSNGLYTPPNIVGTHTVTAQAQTQSANGTVYVTNYPGTFMRDVDVFRTGQNLAETVLTPANVNSSQFGKLLSYPLDGVSDASPFYVANVNIPGQGFHNVVYVATEHDSVYAFDAEGLSPNPLWNVSFINPAAGITTITPSDTGDCCPSDMPVESGITGTPVIDQTTGTLYVVAVTKEVSGTATKFVQRLHALDITTGAEKLGGPVVIQASVPGTGDGGSGGQVSFDALRENQRAALLLTNGIVYIAWAGHADIPPYHGWILGYNATSLQQVMVYNSTPNASGGGVWQSGDGLTTDSSGRIYFVTGNGVFDASTGSRDYGDSIVALNTDGTVSDYFTPHDQSVMASTDLDLGSGGALLLPDQSGAHPHLAISSGKNGTIYVVDRDSMGHYNPNNDGQIVQALVNILPGGTFTTGNFKAPVYFNGHVYFSADADSIKAFAVTNGLLSPSPASQTSLVPGYPGATLQISANGTSNGILWAVQRFGTDQKGNGTVAPGVLHAFDANNLATELYNSNQAAAGRDTMDFAAKWAAPLIANGKAFVASNSKLTIYGLLP